MNVYYNVLSPDNAWLLGESYLLAGGGLLSPVVLPPGMLAAVPEPGSAMLVLFGLCAVLRRRGGR